MNYSITAPLRIEGEIDLPASKSISNRVLLLNALCAKPGRLSNLAQCDDTDAVLSALAQPDASEVNIGAAGTAMRFLTAYFATREGREVVIDGTERMRQRPIGVLVDALLQLGANIEYVEAEGYPPLKITGTRLHGGALTVSGSVSSQYITAILLIAPVIGGITLTIEGEIMSRPYIDMTLALMARYGVKAEWRENVIHVPAGEYTALDFTMEADWSAASYWWAMQAIVPQSRITLKGLEPQSLQGDSRIAELMSQMGVTGNWCGRYLDLRSNGGVGCCCSTFADLSGTPDIAHHRTAHAAHQRDRPSGGTAYRVAQVGLCGESGGRRCHQLALRNHRRRSLAPYLHLSRSPHGNGICASRHSFSRIDYRRCAGGEQVVPPVLGAFAPSRI